MADPITLGILAASTLASATASISGGVAANRNARAEARQLRRVGEIEAADQRRQNRRLVASQQVAFAGAGVDTQVGTPLDVLGDTVAEGELAALRARFGRQGQAASIRARGQAAQTQGIAQGLGTILGGASRFLK